MDNNPISIFDSESPEGFTSEGTQKMKMDEFAKTAVSDVDASGKPDEFLAKHLYGTRMKAWLAIDAGLSIGGAYSWSQVDGVIITAKSVQFGLGFTPFGILGGGVNKGEIKPD